MGRLVFVVFVPEFEVVAVVVVVAVLHLFRSLWDYSPTEGASSGLQYSRSIDHL